MQRVPTARLRLCLHCAVSWTGVARASSVKDKNLVWKKYRAKMYVILNKLSTIQKMNKIELCWLLLFIRAAPCKEVCGWEAPCLFMPDSPNRVRGLNGLFRCFDQQGRMNAWLSKQSHVLPYSRNTRSFPFNEIMPHGPGILSVRDA